MKKKHKKEKVIEVTPISISKLLGDEDERKKKKGLKRPQKRVPKSEVRDIEDEDDSDTVVGGVAGALLGGVAGALLGGILGVMAESFKSAADDDYDLDLDEDEADDEEDENDSDDEDEDEEEDDGVDGDEDEDDDDEDDDEEEEEDED